MTYTKRGIETSIQKTLKRGKSILLLGPRQTGKTTLTSQIPVDLTFNLMNPQTRQHYESNPTALIQETDFLLQEGLCSIFGGFSTGNDRVYKDLLQGFLNNQTDLVTFLLV